MGTSLRVVSVDTLDEPLSLADARLHCRIDPVEESPEWHPADGELQSLITAAREYCEQFTGQIIVARTYELWSDAWDDVLTLNLHPVRSIAEINCLVSGQWQSVSVDAYELETHHSTHARLLRNTDVDVPTPDDEPAAIRIRLRTGFDDGLSSPSDGEPVPTTIVLAMKLLVAHWWVRREATSAEPLVQIPLGVESLLRPYRIRYGMS